MGRSIVTLLEHGMHVLVGLNKSHYSYHARMSYASVVGQDNTSEDCIIGMVPTIFQGNVIDHLGPYQSVWMGTLSC